MLKALVLICSVSTPGQDCNETTALDVVRTDPGRSVVACGLFGQAAIATTAIAPEMGRTYQKVVCSRPLEASR